MRRRRVAVVGVGTTAFRCVSPDLSYRELTHEAAVKAYLDAGVSPHDIDGFISCAEDLFEGYSICDEYTPDQLGAVLKPVHTVPGDALQGVAVAVMMIMTGQFDIVAVQSMSKASNVQTLPELMNFALDPVLNRPINAIAHYVAALEMNRYMYETGVTKEHCAQVVVKNRLNALNNPSAAFGAHLSIDTVLNSPVVSSPLNKLDISQHADGAVVLVLASEDRVNSLSGTPVWVEGIGWCSDSPTLESREWSEAVSTKLAAEMAYKQAGIKPNDVDIAEICDEYSFKELQHMEALGLCAPGEAKHLLESGETERDGLIPVNVSGGALGVGHLFECSGAHKVAEICAQLRGQAGARQVKDAKIGLVQSWRGVPSTTSAVAVLAI